MNEQEMFTSINKGVPSYIPLTISVETLLNECSYNKEQFKKELTLLKELYRTNIINIAQYTIPQEFFLDSFVIRTDYKTALTRIYISPVPFINKLKEKLNVVDESVDFNDELLAKKMKKRVEVLFSIKNPESLQREFPLIYEDYNMGLDAFRKIRNFEQKNSNNRTQEVKDKLSRQYELYHAFGLSPNFQEFIQRQHQLYRNLTVRRQFVEGYTTRTPIDFHMFEGLDKSKFELYLADKYLSKAQASENDREKQECIYYLSTYIRETKSSSIIIHNDDGKEITFSQLVRRYKKFLKGNPLVRPVDEPREHFKNYHIRHVENHVKKYFFTDVNWEIVPPGKEEDLDRRVIDSMNSHYNYLSPEQREQRILASYSLYERKKSFFENSGYLYRIYGLNSFKGYIAYIYENGEVLMEKYFSDIAQCIPTIDEAIYNLKVVDFEVLSKLSKPILIKDKRCKRIIHKGDWERRSRKIIESPSTEQTKEEVKKLILDLKK